MSWLRRFFRCLRRLFGLSPTPPEFTAMQPLFQYLCDLFQKDRPHLIEHPIGQSGQPADSRRDYFRIHLAEMYLTDQRAWFRTVFPALGAVTRCQFAGQTEMVEFPSVVDPSKLVKPTGETGLILNDVVLSPTLPFRGGSVELTAVFKSLTVQNHLEEFINTLSSFSTLLAVPQLSAALAVTGPLARGVQGLFAGSADKAVLGYIRTFARDSLQKGHVAVIAADEKALNKAELTVDGNKLRYQGKPLRGYDYMLLRLDVFPDRDDVQGIGTIFKPHKEALAALSTGEVEKADKLHHSALYTAMTAPELTDVDRRRVIDAIKAAYAQAKADFGVRGATRAAEFDLAAALRAPGSAEAAVARGAISWAEAFAE